MRLTMGAHGIILAVIIGLVCTGLTGCGGGDQGLTSVGEEQFGDLGEAGDIYGDDEGGTLLEADGTQQDEASEEGSDTVIDATAGPKDESAATCDIDSDPPKQPDASTEAVETAAASQVIVDEDRASKGGTAAYWWYKRGLGWNGDMLTTYVNGHKTNNWMRWRSRLPAGRYTVYAFVPRNYATTRRAVYRIERLRSDRRAWVKMGEKPINQYQYYDKWVSLGTYTFKGEPAIFLSDRTGESYSTKRRVGFDAIKFVKPGSTPPTPSNVAAALTRAHADLGRNKYGTDAEGNSEWCLKYVRSWSGLAAKNHNAAIDAYRHFSRQGVVHKGGSPSSAPAGAWLFYSYKNLGHVAMRDNNGWLMVHQGSKSVGYVVQQSNGSSLPYLGYVMLSDATRLW